MRRESKGERDKDNGGGEERRGRQKGEKIEEKWREGEPLYPLGSVEIWVFRR